MIGKLCTKSPHHGYAEDGICRWCEPAVVGFDIPAGVSVITSHDGGYLLPKHIADTPIGAPVDPAKTHYHFHGTFIDQPSIEKMLSHPSYLAGAIKAHEREMRLPAQLADSLRKAIEKIPSPSTGEFDEDPQ